MPCVLNVEIEPARGRAGDRVVLAARVSPPEVARGVHVSVEGYGYGDELVRDGEVWRLQTTVPFEAPPGDYRLNVYAVDASGRICGETPASFTVLP
jgi:hypothetical protein